MYDIKVFESFYILISLIIILFKLEAKSSLYLVSCVGVMCYYRFPWSPCNMNFLNEFMFK